jgi:DNA-binding IclR family transcriptional regulator
VSTRARIDEVDDATGTPYRNQAAQRVLAVLSAFIGRGTAHGVSELGRALGMNKNMVHRALTTLTEGGYLVRDASGERYQLGPRVLALPGEDADEPDIRALCRPFLERLHELTGESVFLAIIVGSSRVNIDWIEARGRRVSNSLRGRSVPLHCTSMSRMLLAALTDDEIAAYLQAAAPLGRYDAIYTETAGQTEADIWAEIGRIRARPYHTWRNRQQYSSAYVGFVIADSAGRPHALVTIGGPIERFSEARIAALLPRMLAVLEPLRQQGRLFPAAPVFVREGDGT